MLVAMYISLSVPMLCYACIKMTLRPMQSAIPGVMLLSCVETAVSHK